MAALEVAPVAPAAPANATPTPAPAPAAVATATPAVSEPAKGEATKVASAAPAAESLLTAAAKAVETKLDYSAIKGEGLRDGTRKAYVDALGEHKIDPKVGQLVLDKVLAAVKTEDEAAEKALLKSWDDESAKSPTFAPDKIEASIQAVGHALALAGKDVQERLIKDGIDKHPAFKEWAVRLGTILKDATAIDSHATGQHVSQDDETERWRKNNPKTIAGLKAMGVPVN